MRLAVTGGTGFVGGYLLARAGAAGHHVRALTRRPRPLRAGVEWVAGTLDDQHALATLVRGADAVIHVAGAVNAPDAAGFERANRVGTANLVAALSDGQRLVHVSSLAAREPDLSHYGRSKLGAEQAVEASTADWVVVRPPAVYGPGDLELLEVFRAASRTGLVPLPPRGRASYLHADDLARLLLALAPGNMGGVLEPDDGEPLTHPQFARAVGRALGRRVLPLPMLPALLRVGAALDGAIRGAEAKLTPDRIGYLLHPDWVSDPACAVPARMWRPLVGQRAGLAETARWYRAARLL